MKINPDYREEIDGVRAVAVCGVILFHSFPNIVKGGFLGVDVFFVISGFLISSIIYKEVDQSRFKLIDFWERRIRRICPVLICIAIVSLVFTYFIYLPIDFQIMGRSLVALSLAASNIYFWLKTDYWNPISDTEPLLHTWSLSVEAQFYIFFPLLILSIRNLSRRKVFIILLSFFVFSIWLCALAKGERVSAAFYLLPYRMWELLLGALLATNVMGGLWNGGENGNLKELLATMGLGLIILSFLLVEPNPETILIANLVPCLGTALIIHSNSDHITQAGNFLRLKPMSYIGKISYSLYLWHWVLLVFLKYQSLELPSDAKKIGVLIFVVLFSMITYHFIEQPFRKREYLEKKSSLFKVTVAFLLIFTTVGLALDYTKGIPSRLSQSTVEKYNEAFLKKPLECRKQNLTKDLVVCSNGPLEKGVDLILWGDSHANVLAPLFERLAYENNISLWSYFCYPVLGVYRTDKEDGIDSSHCYKSNKEFIKYIETHNISNVLLTSFWTNYTEGKEIPMKGAGHFPAYYSDSFTKSKDIQEAKMVFQRNFQRTIETLIKLNVHVYIVKQVPQHLSWIPNQLAKFERNGWDIDEIGRPLEEHIIRQKFIDSVFEIFLQNKHVTFLDPFILLCQPNSFCKGVASGSALYRDYNHLSLVGSKFLKSMFDPIFKMIGQNKLDKKNKQIVFK